MPTMAGSLVSCLFQDPRMLQKRMSTRSQIVLSCQTFAQEVLALLGHFDRCRYLRQQLTTCYDMLRQVEVLIVNFVSPGVTSVEHLHNGTT